MSVIKLRRYARSAEKCKEPGRAGVCTTCDKLYPAAKTKESYPGKEVLILKQYILFAGVNGAGKTTLYETSPDSLDMPRVNLDEIVRVIGSWKNPEDVSRAGREAVTLIRRYFAEGVSFIQETTLCGRSILKNINTAKALGYKVSIYFVGLSSPELAKERVHQRVLSGGHGIPDEDIDRRYYESRKARIRILPVCDRVELYDNTESFRQIAVFEFGICLDRDDNVPGWCRELFGIDE